MKEENLLKEIADLKQRLAVVNEMNVANYNKYCEVLKEKNKYKEKNKNAIEKLEALIVFWKKYNPIDNKMQVEQFEGVIETLKEEQ